MPRFDAQGWANVTVSIKRDDYELLKQAAKMHRKVARGKSFAGAWTIRDEIQAAFTRGLDDSLSILGDDQASMGEDD